MRCVGVWVLVLLGSAALGASATAASSGQLISDAGRYDSQELTYEGELVGSALRRGDFVWLNLHDGENAISVWAPASLVPAAPKAGNYKIRGDWMAVVGVFHRACPQHGGTLDIHARELSVVREGAGHSELLSLRRIRLLYYVAGALICLLIIYFLRMRLARR
jgi:hypothetical protein